MRCIHASIVVFICCNSIGTQATNLTVTPITDDSPWSISRIASLEYSREDLYSKAIEVRSMTFTKNGQYLNVAVSSSRMGHFRGKQYSPNIQSKLINYDLKNSTLPRRNFLVSKIVHLILNHHYNPVASYLMVNYQEEIKIFQTISYTSPIVRNTDFCRGSICITSTYSPDGKLAIFGGQLGSNGYFEVHSTKGIYGYTIHEMLKYRPGEGPIFKLAFIPNSRFLIATGPNYLLKVYDLETPTSPIWKETVKTDEPLSGPVNLAISPDSKWLAITKRDNQGTSLRFYDIQIPEDPILYTSLPVNTSLSFVAINHKGNLMATGINEPNKSRINIYDMTNPANPDLIDYIETKQSTSGIFSPVDDLLVVEEDVQKLGVYRYHFSPKKNLPTTTLPTDHSINTTYPSRNSTTMSVNPGCNTGLSNKSPSTLLSFLISLFSAYILSTL